MRKKTLLLLLIFTLVFSPTLAMANDHTDEEGNEEDGTEEEVTEGEGTEEEGTEEEGTEEEGTEEEVTEEEVTEEEGTEEEVTEEEGTEEEGTEEEGTEEEVTEEEVTEEEGTEEEVTEEEVTEEEVTEEEGTEEEGTEEEGTEEEGTEEEVTEEEGTEEEVTEEEGTEEEGTEEEGTEEEVTEEDEAGELELSGSVTGDITLGDGSYELDMNVQLANISDADAGNIAVLLAVDEEEVIIADADIEDDVDMQVFSDGMVLIYPELEAGEEVTFEVSASLLGHVTEDDVMQAFALAENSEEEFELDVDIDFSVMDQEVFIDATSRAVIDHPELDDNQFTLDFTVFVQNLTVDSLDSFDFHIEVPEEINLLVTDPGGEMDESDFRDIIGDLPWFDEEDLEGGWESSELNLSWDGNTATVAVDVLDVGFGSILFFMVIAESDADLDGMSSLLTSDINGGTELEIPIQVVSLSEESATSPNDEDGTTPPVDGDSDDTGTSSGDGASDDTGTSSDDGANDDTGTPTSDENREGAGTTPDDEDQNRDTNAGTSGEGTDSEQTGKGGSTAATAESGDGGAKEGSGQTLPETGSFFSAWFWAAFGMMLLVAGALVYRRGALFQA